MHCKCIQLMRFQFMHFYLAYAPSTEYVLPFFFFAAKLKTKYQGHSYGIGAVTAGAVCSLLFGCEVLTFFFASGGKVRHTATVLQILSETIRLSPFFSAARFSRNPKKKGENSYREAGYGS